MSIPLIINGTTFDYPETNDQKWGPDATGWASAVTSGMLQKAGGLFQLLAEVDFGTSFGVKSLYYKSRTSNVASAGQIRLANADTIKFRNSGNSGDISLTPGSSDSVLSYAGIDLVNLSSAQTLTNKTLTNPVINGVTFTGQLAGAAGSAAAPTYTFTGSLDTGLYSQGSNAIALATAGVAALSIDSSQKSTFAGAVFIPSGTASLPGLAWSAELTTGLFRPSGNTIGFAVAGAQVLQMASTGIDSSAPYRGKDGDAANPSFCFQNSATTGFYRVSAGVLGVTTAGTIAGNIDASQNWTMVGNAIAPAFVSTTSNPASAGQVRLANADTIKFRNSGNSADIAFGPGSSDALPSYATINLVNISTAQTLTNKTIDIASNTVSNIANANISSSAAIAYSKLALTGSILNADINASAAIAYSKLALTGTILNADINSSAAIAYSKLALTGSILNADINASAAIDGTKIVSAGASTTGVMTSGTQTFGGNKTFNGTLGIGGTTTTAGIVQVGVSNPLTGTNQNGIYVPLTGTSAATASIVGVRVDPATAAAAFTATKLVGFTATTGTAGSGSTITNCVGFVGFAQSAGTNNASFADTDSFTGGTFFLNQVGTAANKLSGTMTIGTGTTQQHTLNTLLATNGAQAATLLNLPAAATAGNANGWLQITINGTTSYIPFWH